jgi:hypothetical protein
MKNNFLISIQIQMDNSVKIDFYLKLANEAAMTTVLSDFYNADEFVPNTSNYAIDVVGTLSEPTGNTLTDDNDMEYPEMQDLDGWHVNIRLIGDEVREAVEALDETHGVTPSAPQRIWL